MWCNFWVLSLSLLFFYVFLFIVSSKTAMGMERGKICLTSCSCPRSRVDRDVCIENGLRPATQFSITMNMAQQGVEIVWWNSNDIQKMGNNRLQHNLFPVFWNNWVNLISMSQSQWTFQLMHFFMNFYQPIFICSSNSIFVWPSVHLVKSKWTQINEMTELFVNVRSFSWAVTRGMFFNSSGAL